MYYTYSKLKQKYRNDYQIKKAILNKKIFKIKPGIYCDNKTNDILAEIFIKRDDAVLTLQSAFYYHGITDYIPESIYIATPKNAYPLNREDTKQIFMLKKYHSIGIKNIKEDGYILKVYDLERTLIELIRYQTKIPFEEYLHVLKKIREKRHELDFNKLISYSKNFKSFKKIYNTIQLSIM